MTFQDQRFSSDRLCIDSYIWNITAPNAPDRTLTPPSPLCCISYNPKQHDVLAGGCYNGLVSVWDLRDPSKKGRSEISTSHHDPVYDIFWISSKTGTEFVTVSTDGQYKRWDSKNLSEPTDTLLLQTDTGVVLGGSSLEYNSEAGATKYLIGTEQGAVLGFNSKQRKMNNGITTYDLGVGRHHGAIVSIQRNPKHTKFFMTVGDWCARMWQEDAKTPLMTTSYHDAYLTGGCWSPSRPGVFYLIRKDGILNVWDYYLQQQSCVYQHKIGDAALTSISVSQANSRLLAIGDEGGTVTLLQVSESLSKLAPGENQKTGFMFDREAQQEKNLLLRDRDMRREKAKLAEEKAKAAGDDTGDQGRDEAMEELLRKVDSDFMAMIKSTDEEEIKSGAASK